MSVADSERHETGTGRRGPDPEGQEAGTGRQGTDPDRHETETEGLDRNLGELLNELRVALPGVQVLFGFLLIAPFNQGFQKVTGFERRLYFATLLCTALASILLIAPSMHHRLLFRHHDKAFLVTMANRVTIVGLSVLAVAMSGAILLVTHVLFGGLTATVTTVVVLGLFVAVWYGPPLRKRRRES